MGPLLTTSLTRDYVHRRRVGLAKPRVWPRKVKQTNGHGAIAQMSPVIQRDPRHPVDLSVRFFLIPPSPPRPCNLPSSSFRTLNFILRSGSSINTHPEVGRIAAGATVCEVEDLRFFEIDFSTGELRLPDLRRLPVLWQIAANDKKQRVRRTIGKIMGRLFRIVVFVCFSRERSATSIYVC